MLLKGAAYMLAELPVGRGRLITDIDILVPHQRIDEVERAFNKFGWESSHVNSYNDRYYRKWGHEIPPLTNRKRGTTLDVHHNILPPTAGPNVNARLLFDKLIEVKPGIFTLSWQDMVIHSATHLFHEGEFHHGLRDLWDLDRMLRDFPGRDPQFWEGLVSRARELELQVSLFHGLSLCATGIRNTSARGYCRRCWELVEIAAQDPSWTSCFCGHFDRTIHSASCHIPVWHSACCTCVRTFCVCRYTCCYHTWPERHG